MDEIRKQLAKTESRIAGLERDYQNSWACGTKSEYEERFQNHIINKLNAKVWKVITGIVALFGLGIIFYLNITIDQKVKMSSGKMYKEFQTFFKNEIKEIQNSESKRIDDIIGKFEWRQSHDFGYVYRNMAEVFWNDKTIAEEEKKRWISEVLKLAKEKLDKALTKEDVKAETYWELGNLTYNLPIRYKTKSEEPKKAIDYFIKAIELYDHAQIKKGWRGGAYEDLSAAQFAYAEWHKGTILEQEYKKKALQSKLLALQDYKELVSKENSWVNESIYRLGDEVRLLRKTNRNVK